jgi:hypothetical protein
MAKISSSSTHEAQGSGRLTVGELIDVLTYFPIGACIQEVKLSESQLDGSWWHLIAKEEH